MSSDHNSSEPRGDIDTAEARMRLALGLRGGPTAEHPVQQRPEQARPKHRFARDGEVPVVVLNTRREPEGSASPRNRLAAIEASLHSERLARAAAERSLSEALASAQALRTQLAHAELAHREALDVANARRQQAELALQEAVAARQVAEELARQPVAPPPPPPAPARAPSIATTVVKAVTAKRKAVRSGNSKPVKWWLPGYRAQTE